MARREMASSSTTKMFGRICGASRAARLRGAVEKRPEKIHAPSATVRNGRGVNVFGFFVKFLEQRFDRIGHLRDVDQCRRCRRCRSSAWMRRYNSSSCLSAVISLSAFDRRLADERAQRGERGRQAVDERLAQLGLKGGVGFAMLDVTGLAASACLSHRRAGLRNRVAVANRLRTTSMTCLGVQLDLERHLVAPAFHASCTMLVDRCWKKR